METINERSGFLCNYEVLLTLKRQRDDRARAIAQLRASREIRVAKESRRKFGKEAEDEEIDRLQSTGLATVTFEAIQYLDNKVLATKQQTAASIVNLMEGLSHQTLNKAERLQIVNLAPTTLVEMVVCVEDFESRFPEGKPRDAMMKMVKQSLVESHETLEDKIPAKENGIADENGAGDDDEAEEDAEVVSENEEELYDEDLVQEGLAGEGDAQGKELDED